MYKKQKNAIKNSKKRMDIHQKNVKNTKMSKNQKNMDWNRAIKQDQILRPK